MASDAIPQKQGRATLLAPPAIAEPIDAIYTWADSSNPTWRSSLRQCLADQSAPPEAVAPRRFRDNGELRYSLRSLEMHAPWIRQVYLVVADLPPTWLAREHPRMIVIPHREIFLDGAALPTFNSNAIEWQLHRIPGLSRRFLYFNDDLFLGRPVLPSTWILSSGGQKAFFEPNAVLDVGPEAAVHDRAYAHTLALLDQSWRRRRHPNSHEAYTQRRRDRLCFRWARRMLPAHVPQLYDRSTIEQVIQRFPEPVAATSRHHFRSPTDFVWRLAYFFYLLEASPEPRLSHAQCLGYRSSEYFFARLQAGTRADATFLAAARQLRPRFLCLNDDLEDSAEQEPAAWAARALLESTWPDPSSFEAVSVDPNIGT